MKTKALRLYGENDVRVEEFELPQLKDDEILAKIISDSLCMSSYKAAIQGARHKRVPNDVAENPIMLGHEFCGVIEAVGAKWQDKFKAGDKFVIQPALNYKGKLDAPGYSFPYIGGCATYIIIPSMVMEVGCLLPYNSDTFFYGSLAEPVSCVIGSYEEFFHSKAGTHKHDMGIKEGGSLLILAGAGPMGYAATDYIIHCERKPSRLVVTDIDQTKLDRMASIITVEDAKKNGVELTYLNTNGVEDAETLIKAQNGGKGFDDVLAMAPVKSVAELADKCLGYNGCLSFFAGPSDTAFKAEVNFYNVHYNETHIVGTVGGNSNDMVKAIRMSEQGKINPAAMVTHIGGLDCTAEATMNLPKIGGGKKLIYTQIDMPLTAIADFAEKGKTDPEMAKLAEITARHNGLWSEEAEAFLLKNRNVM